MGQSRSPLLDPGFLTNDEHQGSSGYKQPGNWIPRSPYKRTCWCHRAREPGGHPVESKYEWPARPN